MVYFISDLHLGLGRRADDKQRERDLLAFLKKIQADCEHLFIVGDLFDYWFEYNTVVPKFHFRTLAALAALRERGIPVDYLIGNHDFGHRSFFEQELDIRMHKGDIERSLHGKRFYLAHGDGKAFNDRGYLILRAILRNRMCQWLYKWLHPDIGIGMASSTSHKSRSYTDGRDYSKNQSGDPHDTDGLMHFARRKIQEEGFDVVIMGHRHKPLLQQYPGGIYLNLGDWLVHRTFGRFDGEKVELVKLDTFLA